MDSKPNRSKEDAVRNLQQFAYVNEIAGFANTATLASIYSASTVVNAPDVTLRGRWGTLQSGFLGEQLLLNFRPQAASLGLGMGIGRFFQRDAVLAAAHADLEEDTDDAIALPASKNMRVGLSAVMGSRRSKRDFSGKPISISQLSTILQHGCGVSGHLSVQPAPFESEVSINVRTAQSGGGLFPISLHIIAFNVESLDEGCYQYQPNNHSLLPTNLSLEAEDLRQLCFSPDFDIGKASFAVVYVYSLLKNSAKYGDAGLVLALIEVGGIAQNLHLIRTALGLAGCCQGGYNKQALEGALDLDGVSQHVVNLTVIAQEER